MTISLACRSSGTLGSLHQPADQLHPGRVRIDGHAGQGQVMLMQRHEQRAEADDLAGAILDLPAGDFPPAVGFEQVLRTA
jgi:hypothetical protein